ncbi:MAG: tetratricopeptide repeat protein [Bradyrhizobium sp.]|nr:tetratricopeptide repeat protein [Bradyrhizobium sp.]
MKFFRFQVSLSASLSWLLLLNPYALAAPQDDCEQTADKQRAIAGCSDVIYGADAPANIRAWAYMRRAAAYDDVDRALSDLETAIYLAPNDAYPRTLRAHLLLKQEQFDKAIEDLNVALRLNGSDAYSYGSRAYAYDRKGDHARAIDDYSRAIKLKPDLVEAYLGRGGVFAALGQYDRAAADYNAVLKINPRAEAALIGRGSLFILKGDLNAAMSDFDEAIRLNPDAKWAYNGRANVLWKSGKPDRALVEVDKAISIDPTENAFAVTRATALFEKGEDRSIWAVYNEAVRRNPASAVAFNNRGFVRKALRDLNGAMSDLDEAIRLDASFAKAWANRGEVWTLLGNFDRALADQDQAIKLNPREAFGYYTRGNTLRYKGDFRGALSLYDKALQFGQYDLASLAGKGFTYEKMGDLASARAQFEKVLTSTSQYRSDVNREAIETAKARLAALDSGARQPIIQPLPARAGLVNSVPTAAPVVLSVSKSQMLPEKRVALVIGNSEYWTARPLGNPAHDAKAVSAALHGVGFQVVNESINATRTSLSAALKDFSFQARDADWAVIYYAGHGVEVNGVNYLIPVDARIETNSDFENAAVPMDELMSAVDGARKLKLVLLDACRDNPFAGANQRAFSTPSASSKAEVASAAPGNVGLAQVSVTGAMLVVYAAKHGQLALDGEGADSPFAVAFLQRMATPDVEINKLFRLVRDDVMEATAGRQEPFTYGSLPGREEFYFLKNAAR